MPTSDASSLTFPSWRHTKRSRKTVSDDLDANNNVLADLDRYLDQALNRVKVEDHLGTRPFGDIGDTSDDIDADLLDDVTIPPPPQFTKPLRCSGIECHGQPNDPVDMLIGAAGCGCLRCVRVLVTRKGANPLQPSKDLWAMTALTAAEYGETLGRTGCDVVAEYLREHMQRDHRTRFDDADL